jgi:hypothetical protein
MKQITVSDAMKLVKTTSGPAISLYLGTNVQDRDSTGAMSTNLQRLYRTAETLIARTYDPSSRERLLRPLKKALAALRLSRAKGGIAIYHSEAFTGLVKIPTAVSDLAVAADSFHLKPILRTAQLRRSYYMLVFRKRYADLIRVTADETKKIERIELRLQEESGAGGARRWIKDGLNARRQRDQKAVMEILSRQLDCYLQDEQCPLLLAGPHHRQEAFRAASSYPHILERGMVGAVDDLDMKALADMSSTLMEPYFAEIDLQVLSRFRKAEAAGLGSTNLRQIAEAAARGQVQTLLIAEDRHIWGRLDRESGSLMIVNDRSDATADDLLDDIAELVLVKGGHVTVLPSHQMPNAEPIAAAMRWGDNSVPLVGRRPPPPMVRTPRPDAGLHLQAHG